MQNKLLKSFFVLITLLSISIANAVEIHTYPLPEENDDVVGKLRVVRLQEAKTLHEIAYEYGVGYFELREVNPEIDPEFHVPVNTEVVIPTKFILPNAERVGMVLNLSEMRLYYYPKNKKEVMVLPIGIGRQGWETPLGKLKIIGKRENPTWWVPESIRKARAEEGIELPRSIPPGPDNPLGKHSLRLSLPTYLLHGTNDPRGVGMRSSSGCIRMYPEHIEHIFPMIEIDTPVRIMDEPYKIGWLGNTLYLESHLPLNREKDPESKVKKLLEKVVKKKNFDISKINMQLLNNILHTEASIPLPVGSW